MSKPYAPATLAEPERKARPRGSRVRRLAAAATLSALLLCTALPAPAAGADSRTFDFKYAATVTGLRPGQTARVWLPVPPEDAGQRVKILTTALPAGATLSDDPATGNRTYYAAARADADGNVPLSITYRVTRTEITGLPVRPGEDVAADLKPDRLVPVGGRPAELLTGRTLPDGDTAKARALYDLVFDYLTYSKDKPGWGRGDANWACDSRFGNCSDFHSLFMSLARTEHLPAKFQIGFLVPPPGKPPAVANYHCWAFFKPADADWVPVDISKAKNHPADKDYYFGRLEPDRVAFSSGRDLTLVPKQDGPPLNFFVYPYVEVAGKPLSEDRLRREISVTPLPTTRPSP